MYCKSSSFFLLQLLFNPMAQEMEMNLLNKKDYEEDQPFSISVDELSDLFQLDNIRQGVSLNTVKKMGGYRGLQRMLKTNLKTGIEFSFNDKALREQKYGTNAAIVKPPRTLMDMVLQNFQDPTLRILCIAAIASLTLGIITHGIKEGWLEGVSILLAVVIIVAVTSFNNYMKEQQFRKLNQMAKLKNVNVTRNGAVDNIDVQDLLVGDVVQVETGEVMSVDGIVFRASNLGMDQSSITGQTRLMKKQDLKQKSKSQKPVIGAPPGAEPQAQNPFLISGSKVIEGTGMMIVLAVGQHSRDGMSRLKLQEDSDQTPLQQKLEQLAGQIGNIGIFSATLTFIALLCHFIHDRIVLSQCMLCSDSLNILVAYFIIAVSIIVIAVPQGLPLAVTLSLAYSVGKMKDQNNLVRFLQACQTMGGANNICTDKTGTLTKNLMTVTKLWTEGRLIQKFDGVPRQVHQTTRDLLCIGACVNSTANPKKDPTGKFQQIGNKTECALIEMADRYGYEYTSLRKPQNIKHVIPFSSSRKKMSTIYKKGDRYIMFTKGAPDFLASLCTQYIAEGGQVKPVDNQFLNQMHYRIKSFANQSLRTILLCCKYLKEEEMVGNLDTQQYKLTILGLVGIKDPLRPQITEAVRQCKRAGIIVRMVTGDNLDTAVAIAKQSEIIPSNYTKPDSNDQDIRGRYIVMEGKTFRSMVGQLVKEQIEQEDRCSKKEPEEQGEKNGGEGLDNQGPHKCTKKKRIKEYIKNIDVFTAIVKQLRVLARSSPQDKYLLALGLKQMGNVVAMTGDGTNDAPALKKADIGFAMGIAGTEVAKEAAGIILLDDNFKSIVTAAKYGRNIFQCIRKFLQFQLTVNIVAIFMAFTGAVIIKTSPLTSIQMLWVNLIMDTLAALALATEAPRNELLLRMPYHRRQSIITPQMWRFVAFHAIFQIGVLCVMLFKGADIFGVPSQLNLPEDFTWNEEEGMHFTLFFNVFVFLQVFNFLNARKLKRDEINVFQGFFSNYLFVCIVIGIFLLQLFLIQNGGKAMKLSKLSVEQHLISIAIGSLSILNGVIIKIMIPQSWLNKSKLFHIDQNSERPYNVDRYINKILGGHATMLRKSQHKRQIQKERLSHRFQDLGKQ